MRRMLCDENYRGMGYSYLLVLKLKLSREININIHKIAYSRYRLILITLEINNKAVLSQGELRDSAVNFDT